MDAIADDDNLRMIRDSVAAIVPPGGDLKRVRKLRFQPAAFDLEVFATMASMGWLGMRVPVERGGSGLGARELCIVAEGLGAGLIPEPFVPCATIAALLPDNELPSVLAGRRIVVPAWQEAASSDLDLVGSTRLEAGRVTGVKRFVAVAAAAHTFLVTTRQGLALVPRDQRGVSLQTIMTQDGGAVGTVTFDGAAATRIEGDFVRAFNDGALAMAAYLFGVTERMFGMALAHLTVRQQFGRLIGSFQVLQHRAADLKIQLELTRAVIAEAAQIVDRETDPDRKSSAVSRAKARASDTAMLMVREATQFHGAIGVTDEYDLSLFSRKVVTLYNSYGSSAAHRDRYALLNFT
jgi:alkylation response protein AidB-like acyl-CoA dehydrogenase